MPVNDSSAADEITEPQGPLQQMLHRRAAGETISFHMPGHKNGHLYRSGVMGEDPLLAGFLPALDTTEVPGTDNLHNPTGVIRQAQERAAAVFGAEETFFLVNGSTCGIYAMIGAAAAPGDEILINRNAHQSVYHYCLLTGVVPRYLVPEVDERLGLPLGITPQAVAQGLKDWPRVKAVVFTRPTFHGHAADLAAIARLVHDDGKVLLVDEAHGAHLRLSSRLPADAMACGADAAVQSTHKTLSAFTQASMLHVQGNRLDRDRLRFQLRLFQTSSPSYLLMASLDAATSLVAGPGPAMMDTLIDGMMSLRHRLESLPGLLFSGQEEGTRTHRQPMDLTRIWIDLHQTGVTGYELDKKLAADWHMQMEMADLRGVLALTSIGNTQADLHRLYEALARLADQAAPSYPSESLVSLRPPRELPRVHCSPQSALRAPREWIPLSRAAGRVSTASLIPYPPGIPLVVPGEIIEASLCSYLGTLAAAGVDIVGMATPHDPQVEVMAHS
ncbi:aminotransferase class I/II-fold pyridoxal phosphate-dependent enzyme [Anoxynatronum buryatiense]|uniref:Arginine decarboxylase n=1 Tax=Anoxynatronum buryatiense TaxID=489973 RepID=A0AA45WVZ0_9CLOT|nr:aminotransferase class V-fold PLP-dependent enzyme [Anoxynatronum buryatiense]SMP56454.1 arginine decarboxylase [Anoxynatronum buryatiense]